MDKSANAIRAMNYNEGELEQLTTFLRVIDDIFPIPLSNKVSIDEYALKTLSKGVALCAEDSGKNVGILLGYANDSVTKNAYIGTLGVLEEYRSQGIGKSLVNYMKELSHSYGMEMIYLFTHKSNGSAVRFYIKNGFTIVLPPSTERPDEVCLVAHLE